jgi:hypothetical protein
MVRLHKLQRSMTIGSLTNDVQGWHISQCSSDTKPHERVVINNQYLCEFTHTATSQDSACMLLRFATPFHLDSVGKVAVLILMRKNRRDDTGHLYQNDH